MYIGDYAQDALLNFTFPTSVNGSPFALVGGVVSVFRSGSGSPITTGIVLTQLVAGLNSVAIDLSSDAAYETTKDYTAYLSAGTVAGVSQVGVPVAQFSIENRSSGGSGFKKNQAFVNFESRCSRPPRRPSRTR